MLGYAERSFGEVREDEVCGFISRILDDECGLQVRHRLKRSVHKFFVEFQPEDEFFLVLQKGGELCALSAVDRLNDTKAILKWFFVAPGHRNKGLGSRLLGAAVRFAEERGYEKLVLGTMGQMPAAQHLYEKSGFVYREEVTFWRRPMMIYEKGLSRN